VLDGLAADPTTAAADRTAPSSAAARQTADRSVPAPGLRRPETVVSAVLPPGARIRSGASPVAATDGAS
jgi:hypothetical protein